MNIEENIHEMIDRYLNGEMSESERLVFEEQLRTNLDLAHTLESHQVANKILIGNDLLILKAQMAKDLGANTIPKPNMKTWQYVAVATTVVTAVAVLLLFLQKEKSNDNTVPAIDQPRIIQDSLSSHTIQEDKTTLEKSTDSTATTNPSSEKQKEKRINKTLDPSSMCGDSLISFSCQAKGACGNNHDGAIEIDANTIKSVNGPYEYAVHRQGRYTANPIISDLKPGRYSIYVKDATQCIHKLNVKVEVPSIHCENPTK